MYVNKIYLTPDFEDANFHLKAMLKDALQTIQYKYDNNDGVDLYDMLDTHRVIVDFCAAYDIGSNGLFIAELTSSGNIYSNLQAFYADHITNAGDMYKRIFTKKTYTFTDAEHETIQTKINNLRDKILKSTSIDEQHKTRVLKKLEELQASLHKKMSTLDSILGGMVSIGHTLGLTAIEAKPFIDEVKDMMEIVLRTKCRDEQLPENNQLGSSELLKITEF